MIQNHIPTVWHPWNFFPFYLSLQFHTDFFHLDGLRGSGLKEHISPHNKQFSLKLKGSSVDRLRLATGSSTLEYFWMGGFCFKYFQCGMKMYNLNNGHCVNILCIEQILGLVIIHPVFLHFNLWFCLNAGLTVRQKCRVDQQNTYSKIHKTHTFLFHPFLSPSLNSSNNFLNLKQSLWIKWNWTEYYDNY